MRLAAVFPYFPVDVGHRVSRVGHLADIPIRLGSKLEWDPVAEEFGGYGGECANDAANSQALEPGILTSARPRPNLAEAVFL